jgi:uncharacterized protein YqeY
MVTVQAEPPASIEASLRRALRSALVARDGSSASACRSALAALGNAGAVDGSSGLSTSEATSPHIAGAVAGLGGSEMARRELTEPEQRALVAAEVTDRLAASEQMAHLGRMDVSRRLAAEASTLQRVLDAG